MPRRNSPVKSKDKLKPQLIARSQGAIDLHFHGAWGIDLMTASRSELTELSERLWQNGIVGFCPTTLSSPPNILLETIERLGSWISECRKRPRSASPIGIHLEGPFIHSTCCGAHPPDAIRPLDWNELERLWKASRGTLKILTIAPETLEIGELSRLGAWARSRKISLSLGHSKASESQAREAFKAGFRGVTHAWNALGFHQRSPGPLGAALGNTKTYVELIIDQIHVAPSVLQWTQRLHPADRLCFISDCVPAAQTEGVTSFGPLKIHFADGACRLADGPSRGALAGGGKLLTQSFCEWVEREAAANSRGLRAALLARLPSITRAPLWALGEASSRFARTSVQWKVQGGTLSVSPID